MIESLGEQIRQKLITFEWITRAGGFTELIERSYKGQVLRAPWARVLTDGEWEYVNVGPDGKEVCTAFVDMPSDISTEVERGRYRILVFRPRIVFYYDEKQIAYEGETDKATRMTQEVLVSLKNIEVSGLQCLRTSLETISVDPSTIWGRYNFKPDDALFVAPYRTFALTLRIRAYQSTKVCDTADFETEEVCCP